MSAEEEEALISASSVAAAQPPDVDADEEPGGGAGATAAGPAAGKTAAGPAAGRTAAGPAGKTPAAAGGARGKSAGKGKRRSARAKSLTPAESSSVARVVVDTPLPHLDRPFDYRVPASLDEQAVPGCRVKVRFAGRLCDGFLLERADTTEHQGRLAYLERVVSPEPVLTPEIAALAREIADRHAGTMPDVLRLAVPPRHARVEAEPPKSSPAPDQGAITGQADPQPGPPNPGPTNSGPTNSGPPNSGPPNSGPPNSGPPNSGPPNPEPPNPEPPNPEPPNPEPPNPEPPEPEGAALQEGVEAPGAGPWGRYVNGASYVAALAAGRAPRAVWSALPGAGWPGEVAVAVRAALASGRGAVVVAADARDVARIDAALTAELGEGRHVALSAELGPAERYRRFLAMLRGQVRAVVGTRAAAYAPVADLGLVVLWDDGDDVHAEPHAPYPHTREVLALRAHRAGAAALIGGFASTAETAQLVASGWARRLRADRVTVREHAPRIRPAGEDAELVRDQAARSARLPSLALRAAREGLASGPVLVQVPRRGYLPAIACGGCRAPARCSECSGPLALRSAHAVPFCRWCGRLAGDRRCPACGDRRIRAVVTGARRTAEELGRAFAPVPVRTSGRDGILATVGAEPALVVATPGAEPVADGGYAAALLLDGWALLGRADLRAAEEALRRWMNAAALVRPGGDGGQVVVLADAAMPAVQALVRWDPVTHAERELAERVELGFPPAMRMAAVDGAAAAVASFLAGASLPEGAEVLGPVPLEMETEGRERALIRVPRGSGSALARALHDAAGVRSARKDQDPVRIQIDPLELI